MDGRKGRWFVHDSLPDVWGKGTRGGCGCHVRVQRGGGLVLVGAVDAHECAPNGGATVEHGTEGSARPEGGREAPALGGGSGAARWLPPGGMFDRSEVCRVRFHRTFGRR